MATLTQLATDTFSGAALDANWTQQVAAFAVLVDTGSAGIRGQYNEQSSPAANTHAWARYTGTMTGIGDDQYSSLKSPQWVGYGATAGLGVAVRVPAGTTRIGYELYVESGAGNVTLYKWTGDARTVVAGPVASGLANNDTLALAIIGGVLTGYKNGVAISGIAYTDSSPLTGGRPGVTAANNGPFGIDWYGGTAAAAASPVTITIPGLAAWTGTAQAGLTVPNVVVVRRSTRAAVLALVNVVADGSGNLVITDSSGALVSGAGYMVLGFTDDGASSFRCAATAV